MENLFFSLFEVLNPTECSQGDTNVCRTQFFQQGQAWLLRYSEALGEKDKDPSRKVLNDGHLLSIHVTYVSCVSEALNYSLNGG